MLPAVPLPGKPLHTVMWEETHCGVAGLDGAADAAAATASVAVPASNVAATAANVTWRRVANLRNFMVVLLLGRAIYSVTLHRADRLGQNCPGRREASPL